MDLVIDSLVGCTALECRWEHNQKFLVDGLTSSMFLEKGKKNRGRSDFLVLDQK